MSWASRVRHFSFSRVNISYCLALQEKPAILSASIASSRPYSINLKKRKTYVGKKG